MVVLAFSGTSDEAAMSIRRMAQAWRRYLQLLRELDRYPDSGLADLGIARSEAGAVAAAAAASALGPPVPSDRGDARGAPAHAGAAPASPRAPRRFRHAPGGVPTYFLKARLKAASDS